ncbi:MAG: alpha/beta hydrolase family protein [Parabacteroides sp.]
MRSQHISLLGIICSFIMLVACQSSISKDAQTVQKETEIFAIEGKDTLKLDRYVCMEKTDTRQPVVLFAFGGGFRGGDRASNEYLPYFECLARQGYTVISIDYRTALKTLDAQQVKSPMDFMQVLQQAIQMAVSDLYAATRYVIEHSESWQIDPQRIVLSGSSAGAITVLQAEYQCCQSNGGLSFLPAGFQYAGVISFAGAIADVKAPTWPKRPCPILLFHGDADRTVPYRQAALPDVGGLWGSAAIAESLDKTGASYTFYRIGNADHVISSTPMTEQLYDILSFLDRCVMRKESLVIQNSIHAAGDSLQEANFTIEDYLKENL